MHSNNGQTAPTSQAFSVWTLDNLLNQSAEVESLLELISELCSFDGNAGNAVCAVLRLVRSMQRDMEDAVSLYQQSPGAITYYTQIEPEGAASNA